MNRKVVILFIVALFTNTKASPSHELRSSSGNLGKLKLTISNHIVSALGEIFDTLRDFEHNVLNKFDFLPLAPMRQVLEGVLVPDIKAINKTVISVLNGSEEITHELISGVTVGVKAIVPILELSLNGLIIPLKPIVNDIDEEVHGLLDKVKKLTQIILNDLNKVARKSVENNKSHGKRSKNKKSKKHH